MKGPMKKTLIAAAGILSLTFSALAAEPVHSPRDAAMAESLKKAPAKTESMAKHDSEDTPRIVWSPKGESLRAKPRVVQDSNRASGYYPGNAKSPHLKKFQVAPGK